MEMNSTYEGYAIILKQYDAILVTMDRIKTDMAFLWMNTKKDNFYDEKAYIHALKETGYLVSALGKLEQQAKDMELSVNKFSMIEGIGKAFPQGIVTTE